MKRHYQSGVFVIVVGVVILTASSVAHAQCNPEEIQKLLASDGESVDRFGGSVSISGDVAIVGAHTDDDNGDASGSAYIYRWDGASWIEEQKLTASDGAAGDNFGISVSISGEIAVVGAHRDDDNSIGPGSAYVYRWNGTSWIEEQKLLALDGARDDVFGFSVAISGDVAIVGALQDDDNGDRSGSAYIFRWDGDSWIQERKLLASDGASGDRFGISVSISGDVAIVGAYLDDDNGSGSGSGYIYRFNGTAWIEEEKLLASDGVGADLFGISVSVSGDVVIVGASGTDDTGDASGSAYIYRWDGSRWIEEQKLLASDAASEDRFGFSVSISGDIAIVGAVEDSADGDRPGSAYVFRSDGPLWIAEHQLLASDGAAGDRFGISVSISGTTAIAGAPSDDDNGDQSGSAYVFDLTCGVAATMTGFSMLDGFIVSGGLPEMASSDDMYLETEALVTGKAAQAHRMRMRVRAITTVQNPTTMGITLEANITDIEAIVTLFLKNFQSGEFEQIGQFTNGFGVDTTNTLNVSNAARFVRNTDGRIELELKKTMILPLTLNGFHSLEDMLVITVR